MTDGGGNDGGWDEGDGQETMIGPPDSLPTRMARSALGDPRLYEELARDPSAIRQAVFVVALVTIVHGIGSGFAVLFGESDDSALTVFLSAGLFTLGGWALSAFFAYMIVSLIAGTSAAGFQGGSLLQFLRSAGFTASPGLLLILTALPVIGQAALLASILWMATALIVAVRETLGTGLALAAIAVFGGTIIGRIITGLALVITLGSGQ